MNPAAKFQRFAMCRGGRVGRKIHKSQMPLDHKIAAGTAASTIAR